MIRVGQRLQDARLNRGLTLEEISKTLKIKYSFLQALEDGDYKQLPSSTYAYGFVRNYAKFLGLPEDETLALFKREYDAEKYQKVLPEGLVKREFPIYRFKFGQTFKLLSLVFVALFLYIVFQYKSAIFNPPLEVISPEENSIVTSQAIIVTGKTDPETTVYVNNEATLVDEEGKFEKRINVFPGKAKITVKAVNKFKKTTVVERNIEVKP